MLGGGASNRLPTAGELFLGSGAGSASGVLQLGNANGASNQTVSSLSGVTGIQAADLTILNPGQGFTSAPTITFDAIGGLMGAQGAQAAMPQGGGAAGGQPQAGQEPPKGGAPGGPGGGQNDPNAKAEGIQVAELQTDESAGPAGQGGAPDPNTKKPQPVAIGDPARQIKPAANAPGVVGAQVPAGNTQQMEKATGGAAKRSSGNSGNKGVERGRVMPAGL